MIATLDGRDVAAIAGSDAGPAGWNTYVAVDDADAATQSLVGLGATVRTAPADAGEGGRGATLVDPEGAELRLWQARRRLGVQATNEPGTWNCGRRTALIRDPQGAELTASQFTPPES